MNKLNVKAEDLIKKMVKYYNEVTPEDIAEVNKSYEDGTCSYLAQVLKETVTPKELCVIDEMNMLLVQNFRETGIKVTMMITRMNIQIAL